MQFEKWATIDLDKARTAQLDLGTLLFEGDTNPVKIGVRLTRGGAPVTAGSASGWAVLADGSTSTPFDNGHEDNEAWIIVPQGALAVPGKIEIFLRVSDTVSGNTTAAVTVYAFGYVKRTVTNQQINPGTPIPSVAELNQAAAACIAATAAANNAVSYEAQTGKTDANKAAARNNIGAAGIGDLETAVSPLTHLGTEQVSTYTKGAWENSSGTVTLEESSSATTRAVNAVTVTPGEVWRISIHAKNGWETLIFAAESNGTYTYVSGEEVPSLGDYVLIRTVPAGANALLLNQYGSQSGYQAHCQIVTQKTDTALTASGTAADAGAVGARLTAVEEAAENAVLITAQTLQDSEKTQARDNIGAVGETMTLLIKPTETGRLITSGTTVDITDVRDNGQDSNFRYIVETCTPGTVFWAAGGTVYYQQTGWLTFIASDGTVLHNESGHAGTFEMITAPAGTAKVIRQYNTVSASSKNNTWYLGAPIAQRLAQLEARVAALEAAIVAVDIATDAETESYLGL